MPRWFYFLLVFAVLAPLLDVLHSPPLLLFPLAGVGILPLAALIGQAVEEIAEHTGERIGGLLFATFGNATELIISMFALSQGLVDVVSASIIGSILGNVLLVLGVAVCVGGFKHGRLVFETRPASQYASLLALSVGGLLLPTFAELLASRSHQIQIIERGVLLSDFIAVLLLVGYVTFILFSVFHIGDKQSVREFDLLRGAHTTAVLPQPPATNEATTPKAVSSMKETSKPGTSSGTRRTVSVYRRLAQPHGQKPPLWRGLLLLTVATIGVGVLSEILVSAIEPVTEALHWNPAFVGLVFVPLIGGLPEYFNTISMALEKRMGMVLAASAGSSIQIALLMAPILVLVSLVMPKRLDLVFSVVELAVLGLATFLFSEITKDGELVWLEGLLLILLYTMMGGTVFLFGA